MLTPIQDTFIIPLTQGKVALVDERDFYQLRKQRWHAQWNPHTRSFYATRMIHHPKGGKRKDGRGQRWTKELMHRRIAIGSGHLDRREVDHTNHNTLDNRQSNLRLVTLRENHENRRDQSHHGPGIRLERRKKLRRPFTAYATIGVKQRHIGMFATAEEAQSARREFLRQKGLA